MKITMYELLGLVKDGKAPKKIKYHNKEFEYKEGCEDYYGYYGNGLFEDKFENCTNFLNDEVEIIEEPKKIEKIELCMEYDYEEVNDNLEKDMKTLVFKINELIDEINNLKEK